MSHAASFPADGSWQVDLGGIHVDFGPGSLARLGELARELGGERVLVVSDPGIVAAGHVGRALESLRAASLEPALFDGVEENPTTAHVEAGVETARAHRADLLVGLGGGSSMDCTKGINFLYTNGGEMRDYWGVEKATRPMLPSIGIPTTAGTGSEAQRFALISQRESHRKMACGDRKARFRTVILDPELITSMPPQVAAVTAMDALSHALESYVTLRRNPISQLFAREAWRLLERSFEAFLADPAAPGPGRDMLLGAHLAGAAIETSMLGAAHSCANPLTARYDLTHGIAIGLVLPHVILYNGGEVDPLYGELAATAGMNGRGGSHAERISRRVEELRAAAELPARLSGCGVEAEALGALAEEAAREWTANFNPRPVAAEDLHRIYRHAL